MIEFCSSEWIDALDKAVSSSDALRSSTGDVGLIIRQTVTDRDGDDFTWHIVIDHGAVHAGTGDGPEPDVTFTQDETTAKAIAHGTMSAQAAFMLGRLRIGGDVAKLMEHASAFDDLEDLFAEVRTNTTY